MPEADALEPVVVIAEVMEAAAVRGLRARFPVHYDPDLFDHPAQFFRLLANARALTDLPPASGRNPAACHWIY